MTPDGNPLVGWNKDVQGVFHAVGMCGQGFMLGPGLGNVIARAVVSGQGKQPSLESSDDRKKKDAMVLRDFYPYRSFSGMEALK